MDIQQLDAIQRIASWLILFILGACFGSFATVLESRIPDGKSVVTPPSACPQCGHTLRWYENIPLLGYLMLRGKCGGCGNPIGRIYPLTELATAVLFVSAFTPGPLPHLSGANWALATVAAVTVPLTIIDIRLYRLPNAITYTSGLLVILIATVQAIVTGDWTSWSIAALAGIIPAFLLFLIAVFSRGGMGLGDVKLTVVLGWAAGMFGAKSSLTVFVVAFLLGGLYALVILITRKGSGKNAIPFGPFLLAGFWITFLGGNFVQNVVLSLWGF
jgi:leader peptidase (prepilin peptidase) / N-methyltransferase